MGAGYSILVGFLSIFPDLFVACYFQSHSNIAAFHIRSIAFVDSHYQIPNGWRSQLVSITVEPDS